MAYHEMTLGAGLVAEPFAEAPPPPPNAESAASARARSKLIAAMGCAFARAHGRGAPLRARSRPLRLPARPHARPAGCASSS
jgi:hypothetical protein